MESKITNWRQCSPSACARVGPASSGHRPGSSCAPPPGHRGGSGPSGRTPPAQQAPLRTCPTDPDGDHGLSLQPPGPEGHTAEHYSAGNRSGLPALTLHSAHSAAGPWAAQGPRGAEGSGGRGTPTTRPDDAWSTTPMHAFMEVGGACSKQKAHWVKLVPLVMTAHWLNYRSL